jgi:hypothetical protein
MISYDPNETVLIPLADKPGVPDSELPALECRVLSRREKKQYDRILEQRAQAKTEDEVSNLVIDALMISVVGWQNITDRDGKPVDFSRENFDVFSDMQLYKIAINLPARLSTSEVDQKKSALQQLACGEATATGATNPQASV